MTSDKVAILFDIDGTLIVTDGAGSTSWSMAFKEIYNIDAQIDRYSDIGMTDPEVARRTFEAVIGRAPTKAEFSRLLERRMHYLTESVQDSKGYHVLPGVEDLLPKLIAQGYLLGLVTGNLEAAAHIKLHRASLNRFFSFGGYGSDSPSRTELTILAMRRANVIYGGSITHDEFIAIGDTPNDIIAAHEAGIECIAVASHKYDVDTLKAAGADFVLASLLDELPFKLKM